MLLPVIQSNIANDYSLWKIIPIPGNRYKIICKAYENSGVALSATSNGYLYLYAYTNDTYYYDEWHLNIAGSELTILSVADCNMRRAQASIQAASNAQGYGVDCNLIISDHTSKQSVLTGIATSEVFISRSHGTPIKIQIDGQMPRKKGDDLNLEVSDIYNYENNTVNVDLSGCELVVFIGCSTAGDVEEGYNIAQAAVAAGADASIGFHDNIGCTAANEWMIQFLHNYYIGNNSLLETVLLTGYQVGADGTQDAVLYPDFDS